MHNYILAIDQGTTGTTSLIIEFSAQGVEIKGRGYQEIPQYFPQPGWVEHDLNEIWQSVKVASTQALKQAGIEVKNIAGIGITNQRETTGLWNRKGEPVAKAIVWQDRRTQALCQQLKPHEDFVKSRTGLVFDPYFSGTKLAWLLKEHNAQDLCFGTIDTWLVYKLSNGKQHITDVTNASRTLMFDIHDLKFSDTLCDILGGIPKNILPEVKSCSEIYGVTQNVGFLPDGIPIAGIAGDQQAALFGQACFKQGMAKCTYGTGAFALVNIGSKPIFSQHGLLTTVAWQLKNQTTYALEGSVFIAGAVVQWLRDGLQFFQSSSEIERLAKQVPDANGVVLVPAFVGLGAPYWQPEARGIICGLTRGTTKAHIARAALDSIALQVYDLLQTIAKDGQDLQLLRVDGGASANDLLMQLQANLLQRTLHRPKIIETTALGAAYLAALSTELTDLATIEKTWQLDQAFKTENKDFSAMLNAWQDAIKKVSA